MNKIKIFLIILLLISCNIENSKKNINNTNIFSLRIQDNIIERIKFYVYIREVDNYFDSLTNEILKFCNEAEKLSYDDISYRMYYQDGYSFAKRYEERYMVTIVRVVIKGDTAKIYTNYLHSTLDTISHKKILNLRFGIEKSNYYIIPLLLERQDSIICYNTDIPIKINQLIDKSNFWQLSVREDMYNCGYKIIFEGYDGKKYNKIKRYDLNDTNNLIKLRKYFLDLENLKLAS